MTAIGLGEGVSDVDDKDGNDYLILTLTETPHFSPMFRSCVRVALTPAGVNWTARLGWKPPTWLGYPAGHG